MDNKGKHRQQGQLRGSATCSSQTPEAAPVLLEAAAFSPARSLNVAVQVLTFLIVTALARELREPAGVSTG